MTLAGYDDELVEIVSLVSRYAADQDAVENARDLEGPGWYGARWQEICEATGLAAVVVPEAQGGLGLGPDVLIAAGESIGRHLFATPYLSSAAMATSLLVESGAAPELVEQLAEGAVTATLAWVEDPASWRVPARPAVSAAAGAAEGEFLLTGTKALVLDGDRADRLVVLAADADGVPGLYVCDAQGPQVTRDRLPTIDTTTRIASCRLDGAVATRIAAGEEAVALLERTIDLGRLVLAAMQVGAARAAFDVAMAYVQQREQFGRIVGSFQVVKHQLADAAVAVETSWALVANATRSAAADPEQRAIFAPLVSAYVSEKYFAVAESALHLHGGIGFTWEADPHLYLKNAVATEALLGTPAEDRELLVQRTRMATTFTPLAVGA